ncbi:hypothetical protein [Bradyrhizobium japonicum]|uniref:hypothetical protein n=2 Tax=Bradyrhizobium japonicum TaxID=375 RepID=UPI001E650B51|nr:hypothetical protein [Bradyrhizobium japonicum]MCD9816576.1 hypothetical protein [Bradyrhizobium japonicum]MCD9893084.1 hypothetical protein [Bradyrhizobium japonicum]MEB2679391.1 hypothetical protein [Bradyrhizobium japonicum]WLB29472.1 hypothetical protein QIH85_01365 [Bradyrhizobium japonicum]WRI89593.1 hypothetical protein R3F75_48805 [Bradyrhizobium japonicum]
MATNFYIQCMSDENNLCSPVIPAELLHAVPALVYQRVGEGSVPIVILDLEHLQVCDYTVFARTGEKQRSAINALLQQSPVRADEMVFVALRSMYCFVWPAPKSNDDVIRAVEFEAALHGLLTSIAIDTSAKLHTPEALLPYWGRLAFLRVMAELTDEAIRCHNLRDVACTLVKRPAFNATTFALDDANSLIGLNFALEPLLKNFNRQLLHFHNTEHAAGPQRMARAWSAFLPMVLYFWANGAANALFRNCVFFDESAVITAQALTISQLDFVLMHELGHVSLDHPRQIKALKMSGEDVTTIRHEFEFAADAFALELMGGRAFSPLKYQGDPRRPDADDTLSKQGLLECDAVRLLFRYMQFVDEAGRHLKQRLGHDIELKDRLDSHPRARDRLNRFEQMALHDTPHNPDILRYATSFFDNVLAYVKGLSDSDLSETLNRVVIN